MKGLNPPESSKKDENGQIKDCDPVKWSMYQIGKIILYMLEPTCLRADVLEQEALTRLSEDESDIHKIIAPMLDKDPAKRPDPATVLSQV